MSSQQKKTVYFVRHGQSVDNAAPVFQSADSPLSETGKRQAASIAERLSHVPFDVLIASPLERAKETAGYISEKTHKEIVSSDLFVESVKPSAIESKPYTDEAANKMWRAWQKSLFTTGGLRVEDSENYDDIIARVDTALAFLEARTESNLVVVTHGYFLRAIVARVLLGNKVDEVIMRRFQERASTENTGITVMHFTDAFEEGYMWRLWTLNDHSHFAE